MATFNRVVASGSTDTFNVNFPYIKKEHVKVTVDGSPTTAFTWPTSSSIQLNAGAPAAGIIVQVRRETPSAPMVNFQPGNIKPANLNTAILQALYLAEEGRDRAQDALDRAWLTPNYAEGGRIQYGTPGYAAVYDHSKLLRASTVISEEEVISLREDLDAETAARLAADTILQQNIDGEAQTRAAVDASLQNQIKAISGAAPVVHGFVTPDQWGAGGAAATDDTASILAAANDAVSRGVDLRLPPNRVYRFSKLTLPDNLSITGEGVLRSDGSLTGSNVTVTLGANTKAERLNISTPGTESNTDVLFIGDGSRIDFLSIVADVQRPGGGIITEGQDVFIGHLYSRKINRPLDARSSDTTTVRAHFFLGSFDIEGYTRGIRILNQAYFYVGSGIMRGRSAYASNSPGHNGVLLIGSRHGSFGSLQIEDSGEHAFRIGGSLHINNRTEQINIGVIKARRPGGCAFKCNPSLDVGGGVTETANFITVGDVVGIDVGEGAGSNAELLRLSHVRSMTIGTAYAQEDAFDVSCQNALLMVDVDGLRIGSIFALNVASRLMNISEDYDEPGAVGHVKNVFIDQFVGRVRSPGTSYAFGFDFDNTSSGRSDEIGEIFIRNIDVAGFTSALGLWKTPVLAGRVMLEGRVADGLSCSIQDVPADDKIRLDIRQANQHYSGRAGNVRNGVRTMEVGVFDPADVSTSGGLQLSAAGSVSGLGNYGGGIAFCRNGSNRRGAAMVLKQTGGNAGNAGIAVFTGSGSSGATEAVVETFNFLNSGYFEVLGPAVGIILRQPNGTRKTITVNDSGALVVGNPP